MATAVAGQRTKARHDLHDRLVEALAPYLGVRHLDRRTVRLRSWTRGWPGLPRRVLVRYAPGAPDGDPSWRTSIVDVVNARLLGTYRVARHDRLKCRLQLVPAVAAEASDPPHCQVRAERAITELIGPTATITGCELDGQQLRSITVTHQAGAKLAAGGYRARVERVISTMLPGRWRAVWDLEGDSVRFEVRPSLPGSVWLPGAVPDNVEDLLANYRQVRIPFGVDEDGEELAWFPARTPHVLLVGTTGSGKTSAGHALVAQVAAHGWPVWVGDSKRVEFLEFRDWPNVQVVAGSIPAQVALIYRAWELMEHRYELIESGRARVADFEPLFVVLDEYAEFVAGLSEWYPMIKVRGVLASLSAMALMKARTARQWGWRNVAWVMPRVSAMVFRFPRRGGRGGCEHPGGRWGRGLDGRCRPRSGGARRRGRGPDAPRPRRTPRPLAAPCRTRHPPPSRSCGPRSAPTRCTAPRR